MLIFPFGGPLIDIPKMIAEGKTRDQVDGAISGPTEIPLSALVEMQESENSRLEIGGLTSHGLPKTKIFFEWEEKISANCPQLSSDYGTACSENGLGATRFPCRSFVGAANGCERDHATGVCRMSKVTWTV